MAILQLNNVPDDLYQRIEQLAANDGVPVPEETVRLLVSAVGQQPLQAKPRQDVHAILEEIRRNQIRPAPGTPDVVEMLREDRER